MLKEHLFRFYIKCVVCAVVQKGAVLHLPALLCCQCHCWRCLHLIPSVLLYSVTLADSITLPRAMIRIAEQ